MDKAREMQRLIDKLRLILANGRDNASFKRALQLRGIRAGSVRKPDRDLDEKESARLKSSLQDLGVLS
jgi:dihydrodipicolinate synthase/N-acetylneuraminate lyase